MDDAIAAPSIVFYGGSAAGQCRNEPCNQYGSALTRPVRYRSETVLYTPTVGVDEYVDPAPENLERVLCATGGW